MNRCCHGCPATGAATAARHTKSHRLSLLRLLSPSISYNAKVLAEFPLEPRLAKVLWSSLALGCADEAATIAAMLGVAKDLWLHPRGRLKAKEKLDAAMADFAVSGGIGVQGGG